MADDTIRSGSRVTLHFAIRLADGELVDGNFDRRPATFTMGDGSLLVGFEQLLLGLAAGDRRSFEVAPEQGFGRPNPANVQELPRHQFAGIQLEPGVVISFADASRTELPGVVQRLEGETVVVDFNHPLAGRELVFEVQILEVV
jgi:FKBP-type peptidyl-prolyl cis-trans isomerase SlpA